MRRGLAAVCIAGLLGACAASGVRYADYAADHPPGRATAAPERARLTIFRSADTLQYAARSASLQFDGKTLGGLRMGGFRSFEAAPGRHRLQVEMWDAPGQCVVEFELAAGADAYFEVAPRAASLAAATPGALVPGADAAGLLASGVTMLAGMSAESAAKTCGGAFSIVAVEASTALPRLTDLRESSAD